MLNINPHFTNNINTVNNIKTTKPQNKTYDKTISTTNQAEFPNIQPDYAVKTPIAYQKIEEINFPYDIKAHYYRLSNGQKVVIVPKEGETVLRTYVNTGSMNEPDKLRGISHYIEHNLFNGSDGLEEGQFFKEVDKMGASTNASTGFAETNYYISSNLLGKNDLENKIKLHASMLETPRFAIDKLEKEKGIVNSEINMILSDPENLAVNRTIKNLYNINSTSTDLIGGTTDNITNLTKDDVVNYYNNNYYPANMVTVITGEVEPDETMKLISKYFTSTRQPSYNRHFEMLQPIQQPKREDIISDKATATSIVIGFNGPQNNNTKDRILMEALGRILTSSSTPRMYKALKPLNTAAWIENEKVSTNPNDGRAILISTECIDENSEKALKAIYNEIAQISNQPPLHDELQIVQKQMLDSFTKNFEYSFAINDKIGTAFLENNQDYINNYEQIVKSITPQDISNTAKKYLDLNKAAITVIHPKNISKDDIQTNYKNANIAFHGQKKEPVNLNNVKMYNLANNIKVITNDTKTDNVYMNINFNCDDYAKSKPSASLILSAILNEGTIDKNQEQFDFEIAKNGIKMSAKATDASLSLFTSSGSDDMDKALKSAKEIIYSPRFTQETFDYVKGLIKDQLLTEEKSANDKLKKELYENLPYGYNKEDLLKDIETVTLEDVKNLYNYLITNSKVDVEVSAPFNKKTGLDNTLFTELSEMPKVKEFSPIKIADFYKPVEQAKVLTDTDFRNQAEIIMAYKFKANGNLKDSVTLELLNKILGGGPSSRLFNDLREKEKLAYSVRSSYNRIDNIGTIKLKIGTTTENNETGEISYDNVEKSIEGFKRHITDLKNQKVSEEELNNAKLSLKNELLSSNESASDKLSSIALGIASPYGVSRQNQYFDMIDTITAQDIYNAANYIFSGKPVYSILATPNTLAAEKDYLDKLN